MKIKTDQLVARTRKGLFALACSFLATAAYSQASFTLSYTGSVQTLAIPAGSYSIQCWGADGGDGGAGAPPLAGVGGKGGYSAGVYNTTAATTLFIYVGGKGQSNNTSGTAVVTAPGGWNGGGGGFSGTGSTNYKGGGGGGSDVRTTQNTTYANRIIVAGGGGGGGGATSTGFVGSGGNGGGTLGADGVLGASQTNHNGKGGTQTAGGAGGVYGTSVGAAGGFGMGGDGGSISGNSFPAGGGGGGWYGGGGGATQGGSGAGGSSYTGSVTSGTTIVFGQPGFLTNADLVGNGRIIIRELCTMSLYATGTTNSLSPSICAGQSLTLMTNAVSNYSWSTGAATSSIVVAPTSSSVYTLTALTASNCTTSRTISITVSSGLPVMSIANPSNNICLGQTATLTATGALSYTWANAGVLNGQTFAPQATAIYTVTGANGCGTSSAVTTITVSPLAVTVSASSSLVCQGYAATLTAVSAVNGYTWQPVAQTTSLAIVSPTSTTIYTVIASDGICAGTQTVVITTKTTPTIAITPTVVNLCLGETTTLTASGAGTGGSYSWSPGNGNTAAFLVSPSSSTLYVVSGTNSLNCTASAQVPVIVVQPLPLNVIANSTLVCSGATVNLSASGSTTYSWTNGPATANNQVNPTAALSIYTVTGFNTTNTCTATRTIAIAAITPSVNVSSPVSMCDGGSATVTASGATTYTWNGVPMGGNNVYVASPAQTATYVLLANTNSITTNCPSTHTVQVVVNSNPTVTVIPTRSVICKGQTNTLTATGAASVVWQGTLGITNAVVIKPTSTTVYTLTGTSVEGCTTTAQISAVVSSCNGIAENTSTSLIKVYPNPSNGQFFISSESAVTLRLINTLGQVIRLIELNSENGYSMEVTNLAKGLYYLNSEDVGKPSENIRIIAN